MTDTKTMNGPLRYKIEISSPQLEAGKDFSIFVRITNPYSIPVKIKNVSTKLPVDFQDLSAIEEKAQKEQLNKKLGTMLKAKIKEVDSISGEDAVRKKQLLTEVVEEMVRIMPFGGLFNASYKVAQAVSATSLEPNNRIIEEIDDALSPEDIETIANEIDGKEKPLETLKDAITRITKEKLLKLSEPKSIELQPGDSIVKVFTLCTKKSVFFTPSAFNLHIQFEYMLEGTEHHDSVEYQLSIKSSLNSVIFGAVLGSCIGFLLRDIFRENGLLQLSTTPTFIGFVSWFIKLVGNVLLGVVIVIAFARKKESQPILTIEDFWGGVMIGAIASYSGQSMLDDYLTLEKKD